MTDQEIRIAVAEALGWTNIHLERCKELQYETLVGSRPDLPLTSVVIPAFEKDLNAMHEAEKLLSSNEAVKFRLQLSHNSDGANAKFPTVESAMCHATARQRAEAFLRTVGKWKE